MSQHGTAEAARHGIARSSKWEHVEREHKQMEPRCLHCDKGEPDVPIQVHHHIPFHYCIALGRPDLELDHRNLVSLCESEKGRPGDNAHLLIGHADDFKSSNLQVADDATGIFHGLNAEQLRANPTWLIRRAHKLPALDQMTDEQKHDLRALMDALFPVSPDEAAVASGTSTKGDS